MNGNFVLKGGRVIDPVRGIDRIADVAVTAGIIAETPAPDAEIIHVAGLTVTPGFIDLHVHLRQPGNTGAETIATGTRAAAAGGFTAVVAMPNTNPAADNAGAIEFLRQNAARQGVVRVLPCGCLTKNYEGREMTGIGGLKSAGVVALSDDGRCIQDHALMRHVVEYAASFGLPILDHCEENALKAAGVMHEGKWSVLLGMEGIPAMSEEIMVARDIMLAKLTGARIHIQHVSSAGSAEMIRRARAEGLKITGEATPHHIALTDECIKTYDTNYKMNPPLRSEADRQALIAALADGTLTVIATDHAPHTRTAKLVEFDHAPFGIVGLETALGVALTQLVKTGALPLPQLVEKFTSGPADVLGFDGYSLAPGRPADLTVFDPEETWTVDANQFRSLGRNTPFDGEKLTGRAKATIVGGEFVFNELKK